MPKRAEVDTPEKIVWAKAMGSRLAWVREAVGIKQAKMAELLGIGQQAMSRYETGQRIPDPYIMLIFCSRFKVSMDYVYRGSLNGVHVRLAELLEEAHPELQGRSNCMDVRRDTPLDVYRASIKAD